MSPDQSVTYKMFESTDLRDVEAKYYNLTAALRTCFTDWEFKESGPDPGSTFLRTKMSCKLRRDYKGPVIEARVFEFGRGLSWLNLSMYVPGTSY